MKYKKTGNDMDGGKPERPTANRTNSCHGTSHRVGFTPIQYNLHEFCRACDDFLESRGLDAKREGVYVSFDYDQMDG